MSGFPLKSEAMAGPIKDRHSSEEGDVAVSAPRSRKPIPDERPAAPHKSWLLLCKENKEICLQAGGKLKKICECCMHNKECTSQEALDTGTMKSSSLSCEYRDSRIGTILTEKNTAWHTIGSITELARSILDFILWIRNLGLMGYC